MQRINNGMQKIRIGSQWIRSSMQTIENDRGPYIKDEPI